MRKLSFIFFVCVLLCGSCIQKNEQKLTIATAANLQFVMEDLTEAFTQKTGFECQTIFSSSGKLTAQIKEGAPYHIFLSANLKYPNELFKNGLTTAPPKVFALGKLVLWSMEKEEEDLWKKLQSDKTKTIALANPKTAPYGEAALQVLNHLGLFENIKDNLVYGESIAQTNQFILSQAANIGFTSKSVVLSDRIKNQGRWKEVDDKMYQPIQQGIVLLEKNETLKKEAQAFYDFLFSQEGKMILEKFGYEINFPKN